MTRSRGDGVSDALLAAAMNMDLSRTGVGAMLAYRTLSQRMARIATTPADRGPVLTPSL